MHSDRIHSKIKIGVQKTIIAILQINKGQMDGRALFFCEFNLVFRKSGQNSSSERLTFSVEFSVSFVWRLLETSHICADSFQRLQLIFKLGKLNSLQTFQKSAQFYIIFLVNLIFIFRFVSPYFLAVFLFFFFSEAVMDCGW